MDLPDRYATVIGRRLGFALLAFTALGLAIGANRSGAAGASGTPGQIPSAADLDRLVAELGDPDYAVRELAGQQLAAAGAAAADALLAAAETSTDLEVALRAGWLAASIPLATGRESP
ncbi:MAG: hypothetical protein RLZZ440_2126, partial [Planctomycetota bacterium]